jgi:hypothetical protein
MIRILTEISKSIFLSPLSSEKSLQEKALNSLTEQHHSFLGEMALFLVKPDRSASIIYKNISAELCKRLIKSNKDILKLTTAFSLALEGD